MQPICAAHGGFIAIVNGVDQFLVGGAKAALAEITNDAIAAGAVRTTALPVTVASHTPLLAQASAEFRQTLSTTPMPDTIPAGIRLLSGIDGAPAFDVKSGADKLARQIRQTVDWASCMEACRAAGVTKVIELGPGSALTRLMLEVMPDANAHSVAEFRTLAGFMHWATKA